MMPNKKRPKSKSPRRPISAGEGDAPAPAPTPTTPKSPKSPRGKKRGKSRSQSRDGQSRSKSRSRSRGPKRQPEEVAPASDMHEYESSPAIESLLAEEEDFRLLLDRLVKDEGLKNYTGVFVRLYEAAAAARDQKRELTSAEREHKAKEEQLETTIARLREELKEAVASSSTVKGTVDGLKAEIDASHLREIDLSGKIESLREQVERYQREMQHTVSTTEEAEVVVDYEKLKKMVTREKQEMANELTQLRKRLNDMYEANEELQRKNSAINIQVTSLGDKLQQTTNTMSLEARLKEKLEEELEGVAAERGERAARVAELQGQVKAGRVTIASLEQAARELRAAREHVAKENDGLRTRVLELTRKLDRNLGELDLVRSENLDKASEIRKQSETITTLSSDLKKAQSGLNAMYAKLGLEERRTHAIEGQREALAVNLGALDRQLERTQRELDQDKSELKQLHKEKETLEQKVTRGEETVHQAMDNLFVAQKEKRTVTEEIEQYKQEAVKQRRLIHELEAERERVLSNAAEVSTKVEVLCEQLRYKDHDILAYERRMEAADTKFKKQVNLCEEVTVERNKLEKKYEEARQTGAELRMQVHKLTAMVDQLTETATSHEMEGKRLVHALAKSEGDKAALSRHLSDAYDRVRDRDDRILGLEKMEVVMKRRLGELETVRDDLQRDLRLLLNERDMIGTQLVRRNDQIHLLRTKVDVLQALLASGQDEFVQRVEDIRLLKMEVRKLRQEKLLLQRELVSGADLRRELYHLTKDLAFERQRRAALEEELQTPMNLHRWRRLETTDPAAIELVRKINLLQKRLLQQHGQLCVRERELRDAERLYLNLRNTMVKLPGPDVLFRLKRAEHALEDRTRKIKSLLAELSMSESAVHDFRIALNRTREELADVKSLYYAAKKKLDSLGQAGSLTNNNNNTNKMREEPLRARTASSRSFSLPPIERSAVRAVKLRG